MERGGVGGLIPATYFPCSTQPQNSHMVLTVDVLSDRKQVTLFIPQVLSLGKTLVSENGQKYTANSKHLRLKRVFLHTVLFELVEPEIKGNLKIGSKLGKT